jgi:hypothetical protein
MSANCSSPNLFFVGGSGHSLLILKYLCHLQIKLSLILGYLLAGRLCIIEIISAQELIPVAHHISFLLKLKHVFLDLHSYYHYSLFQQLVSGVLNKI